MPNSSWAQDFDPPYPRTTVLIWGGASPAWYAEFDWAITRWGFKDEVAGARAFNPDIILSGTQDHNICSRILSGSCPTEWRVIDSSNSQINVYGDSSQFLGDTTDLCGTYQGQTYRQALVAYSVAQDWSVWNGWNTDGIWSDIDWVASYDIDHDGDSDGDDATLWQQGRAALFQELRAALPAQIVMSGWGGGVTTYWGYGPQFLNGNAAEKFLVFSSWDDVDSVYQSYYDSAPLPHMFFINNHHEGDNSSGADAKDNYRYMRFGLATTLMRDGFYSYEDGDGGVWNEHFWVRYYDEYDVPLGYPAADVATIRDHVYCRFFTGGAMILNAATQNETVTEADLQTAAAAQGLDWNTVSGDNGHFYRFAGQQDPSFNDGSVFNSMTLAGKQLSNGRRKGDGILLVRAPNQVVMAAVIIDTENFSTSPGASTAALGGFTGTCGQGNSNIGFRTGYPWCSGVNPYYGYAESAVNSGNSAVFTANLVNSGNYRVYEYHPQINSIDAYDVPHLVQHADGQETKLVDQRSNSEQWNLLGIYRFTAGTPATVTISDGGAGNNVSADAIRFEWAETGAATCGNGTIEQGELCDGAKLGGATCAGAGFASGTLACAQDCATLDTSGCSGSGTGGTGGRATGQGGNSGGHGSGLSDGTADLLGGCQGCTQQGAQIMPVLALVLLLLFRRRRRDHNEVVLSRIVLEAVPEQRSVSQSATGVAKRDSGTGRRSAECPVRLGRLGNAAEHHPAGLLRVRTGVETAFCEPGRWSRLGAF